MSAGEQGPTVGPNRPIRSYARVVATFLFTLALIGGEFALLHGVYHRADPVRRQQVIQARLDGQTDAAIMAVTATPGLAGTAARDWVLPDTATALKTLIDAGLPDDQVKRLTTARTALDENPDDVTRLTAR